MPTDSLKKMLSARMNQIQAEKQEAEKQKDPLLPNKAAVETRIAGRQDILSTVPESFTRPANRLEQFLPTLQTTTRPAEAALKVIGGGFQRAEAGVANVGLNIQAGDFDFKENLDSFLKGVTGERIGNLGDLIRTTGFGGKYNEQIASFTGFMAAAGLGNLSTGKQLGNGAQKIMKAFQRSGSPTSKVRNIPRALGQINEFKSPAGSFKRIAVGSKKMKAFFKEKAELFSQGIDDAFSAMRQEFDGLYNKIGDNPLTGDGVGAIQEIVNRLPSRVIGKINEAHKLRGAGKTSSRLIGEITDTGSKRVLQSTINTAKDIKMQISRQIPRKVWNGMIEATPEQAQLIDDYFQINKIIAENAGTMRPELLRLNAKFSDLHKMNTRIRPVLKQATGTTKTTIRNIRSESMQGNLADMERFSRRFFKEGGQILKDIDSFNKIQKLQKAGKIAVGGAVGVSLLNNILRENITNPLLKGLSFGGDDGGGASE